MSLLMWKEHVMAMQPQSASISEPVSGIGARVLVASYVNYADARLAVDKLSDDSSFDVSRAAIVWNGLRRVEEITGRRTVATAAVQGASAGAWFGAFLGILAAIFVDTDTLAGFVAVVLTYLVLGAVVGAAWLAIAHWMTRGQRDFSSVGILEADSYDVYVPHQQLADAERVLGTSSRRPIDPAPARSMPPS